MLGYWKREEETRSALRDGWMHTSDIAGYKCPKSISFRDEPLPKSGPGKILKNELRAPFWAGRERQVS